MSSVALALRRRLAVLRRAAGDVAAGRYRRYADPAVVPADVPSEARVLVTQPLNTSAHADAKRYNILRAAVIINRVVVHPDRLFSFWRVVGRPTASRGFLPGRSLVGGELRLDYGGGLCQLAGMLYLVALRSGLDIVERHPHSRDLYTEQERYAPLGADAAVAFGLKDLRLRNPFPFPIAFSVGQRDDYADVALLAPARVVEREVAFVRLASSDGRRIVETWEGRGDRRTLLAISRYIVAERNAEENTEPHPA